MSLKTRGLRGALMLGVCAWPAFASADDAVNTVDSVIVTGARNPEDPPVVQDARKRLSETPGAVSVISPRAPRPRRPAPIVNLKPAAAPQLGHDHHH